MTQIYSDDDRHLVRKGEIAVEFVEYGSDGFQTAPPRFAKFREYKRAQAFASKKRAEGCSVKAWQAYSDDQSYMVNL